MKFLHFADSHQRKTYKTDTEEVLKKILDSWEGHLPVNFC